MSDSKRIRGIVKRIPGDSANSRLQSGMPGCYLSEEELEKLIAVTQAEPLLRPPKEFKNDIMRRIYKRKRDSKNFKLLAYSVKVLTATASAIGIMLVMPENIRSEDDMGHGQEKLVYRLNERMEDYSSQFSNKWDQIIELEDY